MSFKKMEKNKIKPLLTKEIKLDDFLNYYWLKKELLSFCVKSSLEAHGTKQEIIERIKIFLATGKTDDRKAKTNPSVRDSQKPITPQTKVIHYKNDAATRKFFIEHIGFHFHFNSYLRQFASESPNNDNKILTYGDLIAGWKKSETIKKDPNHKTEIENQFEYNQFIRDFFNNENGKTIKDAIAAWNFIKNKPGKRDYQHYKKTDIFEW